MASLFSLKSGFSICQQTTRSKYSSNNVRHSWHRIVKPKTGLKGEGFNDPRGLADFGVHVSENNVCYMTPIEDLL